MYESYGRQALLQALWVQGQRGSEPNGSEAAGRYADAPSNEVKESQSPLWEGAV